MNDELTFIGRVTVMVSIVVPIPPPLQLKNKEKRLKANKKQFLPAATGLPQAYKPLFSFIRSQKVQKLKVFEHIAIIQSC